MKVKAIYMAEVPNYWVLVHGLNWYFKDYNKQRVWLIIGIRLQVWLLCEQRIHMKELKILGFEEHINCR